MKIRSRLLALLILSFCVSCSANQYRWKSASDVFPSPTSDFADAVLRRDFKQANRFLNAGANINMVGQEGLTPLLWVLGVSHLDLELAEYLLGAGADPNYRDPQKKVSLMYFSAGGDSPKLLKLSLQHGGNPNLLGPAGYRTRDEAAPNSEWVVPEMPMLSVAASQGRDENIKILLAHGANINWVDAHGRSAACKAIGSGRYDIVAYLLDHGLTSRLDVLARISNSPVPEGSNMYPWWQKVLAMLRERGFKVNEFGAQPSIQPDRAASGGSAG